MYCEIEHNRRSNEEQDGKIVASLAKWLSVRLRTKWLWVRIPLLSLKLQIWRLLRAWSSLTFRQTTECRFTLKLIRDMIITYSQTSIFVIIRRIYHYRFMCNHIKNERYFASFCTFGIYIIHFWAFSKKIKKRALYLMYFWHWLYMTCLLKWIKGPVSEIPSVANMLTSLKNC